MDDLQTFLERYRPRRFEDFFGQAEAVKLLSQISLSGRPSSLVLIGPPGSGKTSLAKVYAQSFSCERPGVSASPCLECEGCSRFQLVSQDTTAASLRELARVTAPDIFSTSCYTFFFIDEAQRIGRRDFDHVLLNIEDPASFSRFVFSTTQPSAIPSTVLERCATIRTSLIEGDEAIALLKKVCLSEGIPASSDVLRLIASARAGDARGLVKSVWELKAHSLLTVEQVRDFFKLPDPVAALRYLEAVFDGSSTTTQIRLLRKLQNEPCVKQRLIHELLQHLYSTERLGLKEDVGEFPDLRPLEKRRLAAAVEALARRASRPSDLFWQEAIEFWEPTEDATKALVEGRAARFASQMQMLLQLPERARTIEKRRRNKIASPLHSSANGHHESQLSYEQAKAIWTSASFLVQLHNITLNARILIRWQRMGVSSHSVAATATSKTIHKLGMAVRRWHPRNSHWSYIYAHEQSERFGLLTIVLLHLPRPSLSRAGDFFRSRLLSDIGSNHAIKVGWAGSGKARYLAYIHRRNLRFILGGLDPSLSVKNQAGDRLPLIDALKISSSFRRALKEWTTPQQYRVSQLIGDLAQERVVKSDMPFLDLMADGAWSYVDKDWEFREYADRLDERKARDRLQLEKKGKDATVGIRPQTPPDADPRLRKRSWIGWWIGVKSENINDFK